MINQLLKRLEFDHLGIKSILSYQIILQITFVLRFTRSFTISSTIRIGHGIDDTEEVKEQDKFLV